MYELVSVYFPFPDNSTKGKPRPGFVISSGFGKHQQVIVAYVTTQLDEILETDIILDPLKSYFSRTGLKEKSLIKLHRLGTFQPSMLKEEEGSLPEELVLEIKEKLIKVFQLK